MQDDLTRAQHYRALAVQMRESAVTEGDPKRRQELVDLAKQYEHLADKLVGNWATRSYSEFLYRACTTRR